MVVVNLHMGALVDDFHVVAPLVIGCEIGEELCVGLAQEIQTDVGEHYAPTVSRVRWILFVNAYLMAWVVLLRQQREVQSSGAPTNNGDLHSLVPSSRFCH